MVAQNHANLRWFCQVIALVSLQCNCAVVSGNYKLEKCLPALGAWAVESFEAKIQLRDDGFSVLLGP